MSRDSRFGRKFRYHFDSLMARGLKALIGLLFIVTTILIVLDAAIVHLTKIAPNGESFGKLVWIALMRTLDPGNLGGDDGGFWYLLAMFLITIVGIFLVSTLIGILSNCVQERMEELRRGRSHVLESGHILILGWADDIVTIIRELIIANDNQKKATIVILAERDKTEMEQDIHNRIPHHRKIKIICRSGNPLDAYSLEIVSPQTARSIILLPHSQQDPDAWVIKGVLAITNSPNRKQEPYHIVVPIREEKNLEALSVVSTRDKIQPVLFDDLIARITAQTSRQSGLSAIYTELLNFENDELYFTHVPKLIGHTYLDALLSFEDSAVVGIRNEDGKVSLNPPMATILKEKDELIGISEDDNTFIANGKVNLDHPIIPQEIIHHKVGRQPERSLIIGWSDYAIKIIRELDYYAAPGSSLTIAADKNFVPDIEKTIAQCCPDLVNHKTEFVDGDTTSRRFLESLRPQAYDYVLVLAYRENVPFEHADSKTLLTLLHLRDMANKANHNFSIVTEILDERNRPLIEVARVDDFIVSDYLVCLMIAQMAENMDLQPAFTDLFNAEGSEIYLKPVQEYFQTIEPMDFYAAIQAGAAKGHTVIGYQLNGEIHNVQNSYGIHLNPVKSTQIQFHSQDMLVVLAEE